MKNFFKGIGTWCSKHIWQSVVIGVAVVGVVATSITLPIALGGKKDNPEISDKVLYGNFITMDETNPTAEAVYIKDGKIQVVGSKADVAEYVNKGVAVKDYSNNFVYPGFVDTHTHYAVMSNVMAGGFIFNREEPDKYNLGDYEAYAKEIKTFVDANPDKEVYEAYGLWVADNPKYPAGQTPTAKMLDDVIPTDKPIVVIGYGGHDCWLNAAAIKKYIGNYEGTDDEKKSVDKWINEVGEDCVINEKSEEEHLIPTGYFCETARFRLTDNLPHTKDQIKDFIIELQEGTLAKGYTTAGDCTIVESSANPQISAFNELNSEDKLKIKFRSFYEIREYDSEETRNQQLQYAINLAEETKNNDYFQVVGIKVFLDGVYEALSAYTLNAYTPDSGKAANYHGIQRWYGNLNNQLKELVYKANKAGLAMEFHAMGDAAVRQALDACQYSNETLIGEGKEAFKNNAISHLGYIHSDDLGRFKELGVTAVVGPQWSPATKSALPEEVKVLGKDRAENMYPIKSLIDEEGTNVAFHTDGGIVSAAEMIYNATTRNTTHVDDIDSDHIDHPRGENERISGKDSLKCLTVNAAKALNSASTTGMIKVGAAADFTVYNKDYTKDEVAKSLETFKTVQLVALYSNGVNLL